MIKQGNTKYWKGEADRLFSLWIRQRFAIGDKAKCSTCETIGEWRYMDNGHFQSRKHNSTRCNEFNAGVQCKSCNSGDGKGNHANGEQYLMGVWLNKTFGEGTAEAMIQLSKETVKMDWLDWQMLADKYRTKLIENGLKTR